MMLYKCALIKSALTYVSNSLLEFITDLSLAKDRNDFCKIVFKMTSNVNLHAEQFCNFLLSGSLTAHKTVTKSCNIGLMSKFTFEDTTL